MSQNRGQASAAARLAADFRKALSSQERRSESRQPVASTSSVRSKIKIKKKRSAKVVSFVEEEEEGKRKGKRRAVSTTSESSSEEDAAIVLKEKQRERSKKQQKKRKVKQGSDSDSGTTISSSSSSSHSSHQSAVSSSFRDVISGGEETGEEDELGAMSLARSLLPWTDPNSLPLNGKAARKPGYLKKLEMSGYRTALQDTVGESIEWARVILEWETMRLDKLREERIEQERKERRTEKQDEDEDEEEDETEQSINDEDEALTPLPRLSAHEMLKLARWPIPTSLLPHTDIDEEVQDLEEELLNIIKRSIKEREEAESSDGEGVEAGVDESRAEHVVDDIQWIRQWKGPRSAYETNAPFAPAPSLPSAPLSPSPAPSSPAHDLKEDEEINSSDSDNDLFAATYHPAVAHATATLDKVLRRLANLVPAVNTPPRDLCELKRRKDGWSEKLEGRHRRRRLEKSKLAEQEGRGEARRVDWKDVLNVAQNTADIPKE